MAKLSLSHVSIIPFPFPFPFPFLSLALPSFPYLPFPYSFPSSSLFCLSPLIFSTTARSFGRQEFRYGNFKYIQILLTRRFSVDGYTGCWLSEILDDLDAPASFLDKSCWVPSNGLNTSLNGINSGSEFRTFERMGIDELFRHVGYSGQTASPSNFGGQVSWMRRILSESFTTQDQLEQLLKR
ncbi:hypothetical protein RCL_jg19004.t1 [Rhizophagus clarus]|uniref:Uncharacterized protein n=1 Tax=Rhizophagus clarus TaxID=94130 RepID=A0A8H3LXC6_9GLOM|nr:hypothetical protein RCL_jg19004.t1 [Rhizophagus clarus]